MDLDSGIADRTDGDRQSDSLQQGKVHVDVEALRLKAGEAVCDGLKSLPHRVEMIEPFLQAEVAQIVGTELVAQEAGELLVLFEKGILPVGAENMVAMFDLIDHGREFPVQPFIQPDAKDLADAVRRQPPEADFTASFEDFVDREVAF